MANTMTKSEIANHLAEASELPKKTVVGLLENLAQLAYKQAKNSFTLPGLGKLVLVNRKARTGRNSLRVATERNRQFGFFSGRGLATPYKHWVSLPGLFAMKITGPQVSIHAPQRNSWGHSPCLEYSQYFK